MNLKLLKIFIFFLALPAMLLILLAPNAFAITLPANVYTYSNITLGASWSSVASANVQQMITLNITTFNSFITYNSNIANFEYFYTKNGTIIPSWIESNATGNIITWTKISNTIATTNSIAIGFTSKTTNLLSSSGTSGIGEAPQLSSTYGEYDNGADVFPYYQAWGGLSALPTGWTAVAGTSIGYNPTNIGIATPTTTTGWYGISLNPLPASLSSNTTTVWEYYGNEYDSATATGVAIASYVGTAEATPSNFTGYSFSEGDTTTPNLIYLANGGTEFLASTGYDDTNTNKIYTMSMASATSLTMQINYTNIYTTTTATAEALTYFDIGLYYYGGTGARANPITMYWLRTRAYPPSGVMPSVTFGAVQAQVSLSISPNPATYGQAVTINATCPYPTDSCAIDYPSLGTAIATGTGSATYTYNAFSLAAGTYSTYYANDITLGTNSIGQTLTVNKATPTLSLPNFPANYSYNGNSATITANIISHNNQLNGNLYLSSTLVASTNTQTTYSTSASAGTYAFTFNTLGNANYTSASISNTLQISQNSTYPFAWLKKGTNQTWSNTPINTTAQITTHNNQLSASLYLNSGFIATTTTTTTQLNNKIGFYKYVFNTTGNTNYTANSINYEFWIDVPISMENISAAGASQIKSINYSASPFTWNTYYPVKLYTASPSNTINYTLTQNLGGTLTTLSANTLNISYVPPANQITGNYIYSILERQANDSNQILTLRIAANTLNMTDINSAFNFSSQFQYFSILAHTPTWTAKPSSWYILSSNSVPQITQNTSTGAVFSTNAVGAFTPQIHLVYPFTSFILNYTNNPKAQNSITIQPFQFILANSISASLRNIANLSIYDQETFNSLSGANATFNVSATFNNYIFSNTVSNNTETNGKYFLEMPKSNYQNPNITIQLNGTVSKPLFFAPSQLFCPSTISYGSSAFYQIGLVDTNGTKYSFYIYTNTGSSASGYILFINELQGVSARGAESLVIPPSLPMAVPLEQTGQEYQYIIYSPNCKNAYYKGSFVDPTNPTYLTLTTGASQAVLYNTTNVTGACALNTSVNPYKLVCVASDPDSKVYEYKLDIFNSTNILGQTSLVKQVYENSSSFSYNAFLPINQSYSYSLYAYAFKQYNSVFLVNGGSLNSQKIQLSAPLLGIFAFILLLTLTFVGIKSGKVIILLILANVGLLAVSMLNLVQIPTIVSVVFIFVGIIISVWSIKVR